jgi:serine/threonine protein kinase
LELVTGGELFDRIIELQRYSEKEAVHVMLQALSGLKHMHDRHIAHRDLKPENLLLSSKEPHATVKLADFGFATKLNADNELLQLVGTPPYFAPELSLLRDESIMEGYGRPVDIWSMGVILYILLSGIHPFQIADEDVMLDNIQNAKWDWVGPNWSKVVPIDIEQH